MRKLGLALSGGGFRASFFHIGVLARLAELDLLRSIEVLSCVSGGSIIGAYYYLHVKKLLESVPDDRISAADYCSILRNIERDFLEGVQTNVRVRAFSNFWKNWRMVSPRYSRSDRMAELYDAAFYDRVAGKTRITLDELNITPHGTERMTRSRRREYRRHNKVPMLILNASTLNSGHNWQFTPIDMGERDAGTKFAGFEKTPILSAFRYDAANLPHKKYRKVPLSIAVAASAAVPGIFHPLPLTDLYPNVVPQLVDGGVYDNQGISPLVVEQCTEMIVSDASGQMQTFLEPGTSVLNVIRRTNTILMDRVRSKGLESVAVNAESSLPPRVRILHLLEGVPVPHLSPGERLLPPEDAVPEIARYGIDVRVQRRLAGLRTDLDSFTDIEAYSLMYSGYRMAELMIDEEFTGRSARAARSQGPSVVRKGGTRESWEFLKVDHLASSKVENRDYLEQLEVGQRTFFKAYVRHPSLIPLGILIACLAVGVPAGGLVLLWVFGFGGSWTALAWLAGIMVLTTALSALPGLATLRHAWWNRILEYTVVAAIALSGSMLAFLHLKWIDPKFIAGGAIAPSRRDRRHR